MTKRAVNIDGRNINKKPKLDNEIEALWGDEELDESVFDDFIKLDSQEHKENETVLLDYDIFKVPKQMFSSTQIETGIQATGSKPTNINIEKNKNIAETDIKKLRLQCEEKDGEIAVLRSQLNEIKTQNNSEFHKSQAEWKTKFSLTEKQIQSVRSELEFKNLEIANLKQKVISVSKTNLNDVNCIQKPPAQKKNPIIQKKLSSNKLYAASPTDYPLQGVVNESMFTIINTEKLLMKNKQIHSFKNTIPYLQNKTVSTRIVANKGRANLQLIYPIMLKFNEFRTEEIDCTNNVDDINMITCIALQSLDDLFDLLQEIKRNLRTEDVLEADCLYLKSIKCLSESGGVCKDELGRKSAFVVNFLSEVLPYCSYLKDYFLNNKPLVLTRLKDFTKQLPYIFSKKIHIGRDFLNKLVAILSIVGEMRKANVMSSFLQSTINIVSKIFKLKGYLNLPDILTSYAKELIFLRPPGNVAFQVTYLLKEASRYTSFIQFLLNKSQSGCTTKKGVIYFNKDACRFNIFVLVFARYLSKNKAVPKEIYKNMLVFIYNTYKSSYFLHHQDIKECECLPQLYKLEIEIIFRSSEKPSGENTEQPNTNGLGDGVFYNKLVLKVLNLMNFHCFELIEKYITVYSQFKEIERRFREHQVCDLERLNNHEEIPEIDSSAFNNIGF